MLAATNQDPKVKADFGRPFRARLVMVRFPGLKPWAVIFNHFMVRGPKGCWSLGNFLTFADDLRSP